MPPCCETCPEKFSDPVPRIGFPENQDLCVRHRCLLPTHQPSASFPGAEVGPQSIFVITFVERKDKNLHKKIIKYNHDYETGWSGGEVTFRAILWRKCHPEEWAMRASITGQLPLGLSATLLRKKRS